MKQSLTLLGLGAALLLSQVSRADAIDWKKVDGFLQVTVEDEGPGLPDTSNLFVPFFTTKQGGSGIGLVLCRQIAEAHDGTLLLENRTDVRGCRATLRLPVGRPASGAGAS